MRSLETSGAVVEIEPSTSTSRRSRDGLLDLLAVGERPLDGDVAGELLPLGEGLPAGAGHVHERLAVGVVGEQAVDPLELEAEVAAGAGLGEGLLLGLGGPTDPWPGPRSEASDADGGDGGEQEPLGAGRRPRRGWWPGRRRRRSRRCACACVSNWSAACSTAMWRASTSSMMAASSGAEPMASASEVRSPSARRSASAAPHTRRWSSGGEHLDGLAAVAAGGQVGGAEAHHAASGPRVEAEPGEQVAAAVGVGELGGDVAGPVDVDDAVPAARGAEHGEVPAAALLELQVEARAAAAEGADQLADQALSLHPSHPGHHGEPGVQIKGQGVVASLDHQPFHAHDQVDRRSRRVT